MTDRGWMVSLTDEQRGSLVWRCVWCDATHSTGGSLYDATGPCSAPDGDGHAFEPVRPKNTP